MTILIDFEKRHELPSTVEIKAVYFVRKVNNVLRNTCPKCEGKAKRNTPRTIPVSKYE